MFSRLNLTVECPTEFGQTVHVSGCSFLASVSNPALVSVWFSSRSAGGGIEDQEETTHKSKALCVDVNCSCSPHHDWSCPAVELILSDFLGMGGCFRACSTCDEAVSMF